MFQVSRDWNPRQARLKEIILKPERLNEARELLLQMHRMVHASGVYNTSTPTYMDEITLNLSEQAFRTMPTIKDATIAWDIWHITRIEDLTANILIADSEPILNDNWLKMLGTKVRDTGNAMTDEEIIAFSRAVRMDALFDYRNAVGHKTREILQALSAADLKRRMRKDQLDRIAAEGGVLNHPQSAWLLDFWGRKTVAGLCLMPITRHQVVHLSDCAKLKVKCGKRTAT